MSAISTTYITCTVTQIKYYSTICSVQEAGNDVVQGTLAENRAVDRGVNGRMNAGFSERGGCNSMTGGESRRIEAPREDHAGRRWLAFTGEFPVARSRDTDYRNCAIQPLSRGSC